MRLPQRSRGVTLVLFGLCAWLAIFKALSGDGETAFAWSVAALLAFESMWRKR
jgi:hypothetical protein